LKATNSLIKTRKELLVDYAIHSWEAIYDLNKATNSSTCAKSMYQKATAEIKYSGTMN
jgi:hypothetical protein